MRHVSRRFKEVSEMPLLWREFVWLDYEPRHVCSVSNALEVSGEHVRRMFIPTHVTPTKILEMVGYCTKVTHLSLPSSCQLSLDQLEDTVNVMTDLKQLDVFTDGNFIQQELLPTENYKSLEGLLKVTAARVKELNLRPYSNAQLTCAIASIERRAKRGHPLPLSINIYPQPGVTTTSAKLFKFWSSVLNFKLSSFEIGLYDTERTPMNLYAAVPLRKFQFGPSATPPFIRFSSHGITGLKHDVFHLREYDHHGTVRYALTPELELCKSIEEKHFSYPTHLHCVSYADISNSNVHPDHLRQLTVVCPNLEQLNIQGNVDCLKDLEGLCAIVHTCQNLESLNLAGISVSSVESYLLLWELLSCLKNLTHLVIDLCVLQPPDSSDANKQSLTSMFRSCRNLKALEICCDKSRSCTGCNSNREDFLFSCFPSLTHCTMRNFQYSGIMYAISNCHRLKYLHEYGARAHTCEESLLPLSNSHHLQELHIDSPCLTLTDEIVEALSTHGELERVTLHINSITISAITALINNSPNLMLLKVSIRKLLFNDSHLRIYNHTNRVKKMLPHHKLFDIGKFTVHSGLEYFHYYK